jgi:large subunit ribosomal protein L15
MPKLKGFSNARFRTEYNIINISDLVILSEKGIEKVDKEVLIQNNMIRKKSSPVKLL